jgi:hypothetical protein
MPSGPWFKTRKGAFLTFGIMRFNALGVVRGLDPRIHQSSQDPYLLSNDLKIDGLPGQAHGCPVQKISSRHKCLKQLTLEVFVSTLDLRLRN